MPELTVSAIKRAVQAGISPFAFPAGNLPGRRIAPAAPRLRELFSFALITAANAAGVSSVVLYNSPYMRIYFKLPLSHIRVVIVKIALNKFHSGAFATTQ